MSTGLPLMKNILTSLAKSVLMPLGVSTTISATDAAIQKKILGSGRADERTDEMEDIIKIIKSLEESILLIEGISKTIKNEAKEQKGEFLPMLLGTLAANLLGSALTGQGLTRADEEVIRAGQSF